MQSETTLQKRINAKPKRLFLIDGIGALVSFIMLGFVLVRFQAIVGIPIKALYILASLPVFFMLYDIVAYFSKGKTATLLKGIALLNLLYFVLSLFLAWTHKEAITVWGWIYIIVELVILSIVIWIEYKAANSLSVQPNNSLI